MNESFCLILYRMKYSVVSSITLWVFRNCYFPYLGQLFHVSISWMFLIEWYNNVVLHFFSFTCYYFGLIWLISVQLSPPSFWFMWDNLIIYKKSIQVSEAVWRPFYNLNCGKNSLYAQPLLYIVCKNTQLLKNVPQSSVF